MLTHPTYRTTETKRGADLNYDCPCGCIAGFAFIRGVERAPESCCCGRAILAGERAEECLRTLFAPGSYEFEVQLVLTPWGEPLEVALATPEQPSH